MKIFIIGAVILLLLFIAFNKASRAQQIGPEGFHMKNTARPTETMITGGQPTIADLVKLKEEGVTTVINLRGLGENLGYNEAVELEVLGLKYVQIPMSGGDDLTIENATKLDEALKSVEGKVLVHCASSNRVGALLAIREFHLKGKSKEDALAFGVLGGMKSLTPAVEQRLVK